MIGILEMVVHQLYKTLFTLMLTRVLIVYD